MVIITGDKKTRWKDDFYPTPLILCERIVEDIVGRSPIAEIKGARILDPGCGNGHFGVAIKHHFPNCHLVGIDTVDRLSGTIYADVYDEFFVGDYTNSSSLGLFAGRSKDMFHLVIGNPPFKYAEKFIRISHAICKYKVVFLLKLAFLSGQDRLKYFWPKYPPNNVYALDARISWDGSGKSNDQDHAIYEWQISLPMRFGYTYLKWLKWR